MTSYLYQVSSIEYKLSAESNPAVAKRAAAAASQSGQPALASLMPTASQARPLLSQPMPFTASPLSRLPPFSFPTVSSTPWQQLAAQNKQLSPSVAPVPSPGHANLQSSGLRRDSPNQTGAHYQGSAAITTQPAIGGAGLTSLQGMNISSPIPQTTREKVAAVQEHLQRLQQTASNTSLAEREQAISAAVALLASLQTANDEWAPRRIPSPAEGAPGAQSMQRGTSQHDPIFTDQAAAARRTTPASAEKTAAQPASPQLLVQRAEASPQAASRLPSQAASMPTESLAEAQVTVARISAQEAAQNVNPSVDTPLAGQASTLSKTNRNED